MVYFYLDYYYRIDYRIIIYIIYYIDDIDI